MEYSEYEEPRIFRVPVVLLSLVLILITTILGILIQFVVSECDYVTALIIQVISWVVCFVGLFAFTVAVIKKLDLWMLPVLVVTIYGLIDSLVVITIAIISSTGSESCVSLQVRAGNATCATKTLWTCDIFNDHVQNTHGGNLNEVIVEYSIIVAVYAAVLAAIYMLSFFSHCKVFQYFRKNRNQEKNGQSELEEKIIGDIPVALFEKDAILSSFASDREQ